MKKDCKLCELDQAQLLSWLGAERNYVRVQARVQKQHSLVLTQKEIKSHFSQHGVQRGQKVRLETGLARELKDRYKRVLYCLAKHGLTYSQTIIQAEYIGRYANINAARAAAYRDLHWLRWNGYVESEEPGLKDIYRPHWDRRQELVKLSQLGERYLQMEKIKAPKYQEKLLPYQSIAGELGLISNLRTGGGERLTYTAWNGKRTALAPPAQTDMYIILLDEEHKEASAILEEWEGYIGYMGKQTIIVSHRTAALMRSWRTQAKTWEGLDHRVPWLIQAQSVNWSKVIDLSGAKIDPINVVRG